MGLVVSNYSQTMQQAMFVMFFFVIIIMLMSGLFTPINSMPEWAQTITIANPLKYFIQVTRMVYLKGSGFSDLIMQFIALFLMANRFERLGGIQLQKEFITDKSEHLLVYHC